MTLWLAPAFGLFVMILVILDLGLLTRRPRFVKPVEAFTTYALWLLAAAGFSVFVWKVYQHNFLDLESQLASQITAGPEVNLDGYSAWLQYVTAYVLEVALSLDNIAVLALLVSFFKVPRDVIGRALFWSLLITLMVRLAGVFSCAWFMRELAWFRWVLGGVLMVAMVRMLVLPDEQTDFEKRWYVRAVRRIVPLSRDYDGPKLFTKINGRTVATPIVFVVLIAGMLDVVFAADSIPAMFSVTKDPMIAFSASAMAILGLRSLYFTLSGVIRRFRYLRVSMVFVLLFVAAKMFLSDPKTSYDDVWTLVSLGVVTGIMLAGIAASAIQNVLSIRNARMTESKPALISDGEVLRYQTLPAPLEDLREAVDVTRRNLRKVVVLIVGTLVIVVLAPLVGVVPGPGGMIVAAMGLGILATEFLWARKLLMQIKAKTQLMASRTESLAAKTWIGWVPIVLGVYVGAVVILAWKAPYEFHIVRDLKVSTEFVLTISVGPAVPIAYWAWSAVSWRLRTRKTGNGGRLKTLSTTMPNAASVQREEVKSQQDVA